MKTLCGCHGSNDHVCNSNMKQSSNFSDDAISKLPRRSDDRGEYLQRGGGAAAAARRRTDIPLSVSGKWQHGHGMCSAIQPQFIQVWWVFPLFFFEFSEPQVAARVRPGPE